MKFKLSWVLSVLLLASASAFAQREATPQPSVPVLHNRDVLRMVREGIKPGEIIARIVTSSCEFDTFPPVLQDLKMRGVPDAVLMAMKMVPYGPPAMVPGGTPTIAFAPKRRPVQIPAGTVISVQPAKAISSAEVDTGNPISFLVSRRVLVDGALAIDRGALATGRVLKSKRAASWGRGGTLEFTMEDVVTVDGTRVPIQLSQGVKGGSHTTAVAAAAVVTGAIVFPYSTPVALLWGLRKGNDAVLDQGTKLNAIVKNKQEISAFLFEPKKPIFHSLETIDAASRSTGLQHPFNNSFRPTPISQ